MAGKRIAGVVVQKTYMFPICMIMFPNVPKSFSPYSSHPIRLPASCMINAQPYCYRRPQVVQLFVWNSEVIGSGKGKRFVCQRIGGLQTFAMFALQKEMEIHCQGHCVSSCMCQYNIWYVNKQVLILLDRNLEPCYLELKVFKTTFLTLPLSGGHDSARHLQGGVLTMQLLTASGQWVPEFPEIGKDFKFINSLIYIIWWKCLRSFVLAIPGTPILCWTRPALCHRWYDGVACIVWTWESYRISMEALYHCWWKMDAWFPSTATKVLYSGVGCQGCGEAILIPYCNNPNT